MTRWPIGSYAALALALVLATRATAADWPTYRGDSRRSGYTSEQLPAKLSPCWTYRSAHAPRPAWSGRDTRMPFDRAYTPVVSGGTLFFGSSADDKVYALDAATGHERWSFFTDAPVRFPPTIWRDRLFAVSDDGFLYCLAADDGLLLWKKRGGPTASMVLGNDRLTSRWPARGAPVVADGVVYFAAGIWPSEGIHVYALEAETGKVIWCNNEAGGLYMGQPHGGANARSGISAQGHLVVAGDVLLVPTGRAVPAALNRADGRLLYFRLQENTRFGGAEITVDGNAFFNGQTAFDVATGSRHAGVSKLDPAVMAVLPETRIDWHDGDLRSLAWATVQSKDRRGKSFEARGLKPIWSAPVPYGDTALLVAGNTAISAGSGPKGHGVSRVDLASRKVIESHRVDGVPWGLAAAGGRLFVSTDAGAIHCFDGAGGGEEATIVEKPRIAFQPAGRSEEAAAEIVRASGVTRGYCVELGLGSCNLAGTLARRTGLHVYAVDPDPAKVAEARGLLDAASLYGVRATVHLGDPTQTVYPKYMADLVVSGRSVDEGSSRALANEASRLKRPCGGVAVLGKPSHMEKTVRGPLDGAGSWTHQYCDPANTNCSADTLVKRPLEMLWFTDFGFPMPSRHGRGRAPLVLDGRMFILGLDGLLCVDAYNGRKLWKVRLPGIQAFFDGDHLMGTSGTGSNLCIGRHGLFVHTGDRCLRLDPATGKRLGQFPAPPRPDGKPGRWGVIACVGDTLFGTLANTGHVVTYRFQKGDVRTQFTESLLLFALDAQTGRLKWRYQPEHSIRHNTIAVGGGRVHLIDRAMAMGDRHREKKRGVPDPGDVHPGGTLVTLDAQSGKLLWKTSEGVFGTMLVLSETHQTLLMAYQDWRFKLASELGGRMAAFDASTGQRRWEVQSNGTTRPVLKGRTIYFQPGTWDLLTGEPREFTFERSYGCGIPAGSRRMMLFRSATLGYLDLEAGKGTENYGGIRPGCWINALPAAGLVLMPDATDGCTCSYLIKASIALAPAGP